MIVTDDVLVYTVTQVSGMEQLSPRMIRNYIAAGRLRPVQKLLGHWLIGLEYKITGPARGVGRPPGVKDVVKRKKRRKVRRKSRQARSATKK